VAGPIHAPIASFNARWATPLFPLAAHVFSVIGGLLIAVVGIAQTVLAFAYPWQLSGVVPGSSVAYAIPGVIGVVCGVAITALGFRLRRDSRTARSSGIMIIAFSLVSIFGGGGLFLGLVFAFVGGILAMTWRMPSLAELRNGLPSYRTLTAEAVSSRQGRSPPVVIPPSVTKRFCMSCGTENPLTSRTCSKCQGPLY